MPPVTQRSPQAVALVPQQPLSRIVEALRRWLAEPDLAVGPSSSPPPQTGGSSAGVVGVNGRAALLGHVAGGSVLSPAPVETGDWMVEQSPSSAKTPEDQAGRVLPETHSSKRGKGFVR